MDIITDTTICKSINEYKENKERIRKEKYVSCKELVNIVNKIVVNPNYKIDKTYKLKNIEKPISNYFLPYKSYNTGCDDFHELINNINNNHPKIRFNVKYFSNDITDVHVKYREQYTYFDDIKNCGKLVVESEKIIFELE